jgi:hypothetical protein
MAAINECSHGRELWQGDQMEYRSEIFREQFPLVKHSLCHLIYYRVLGQQYRETSLKSPFWTLTINGHMSDDVEHF